LAIIYNLNNIASIKIQPLRRALAGLVGAVDRPSLPSAVQDLDGVGPHGEHIVEPDVGDVSALDELQAEFGPRLDADDLAHRLGEGVDHVVEPVVLAFQSQSNDAAFPTETHGNLLLRVRSKYSIFFMIWQPPN